jgi:hypothetical protein
MLALHPLTIEVHLAAEGGLNSFRAAAREYLSAKDHFVITNEVSADAQFSPAWPQILRH